MTGLDKFDASTMIPARNVDETRRFYEDVLGFSVLEEIPDGITYRTGSGRFTLYPSEAGGAAEHTLIGWYVDDIEKVVEDLAAAGVTFERYDYPDFSTDDKGIADFGGGKRGAWFKDPEGNILSVWQG